MTNAYVVTGTLTDAKTVQLDEPLPMSAGKVRLIVEATPPTQKPSVTEVMERIWAEQVTRGQVPPTADEVNTRIRDVRAGWDDSHAHLS
jgi:hypothetical protein